MRKGSGDPRADAERDEADRYVGSDDVAERQFFGFGPGEQQRQREGADSKTDRGAAEVLGKGFGSPDD